MGAGASTAKKNRKGSKEAKEVNKEESLFKLETEQFYSEWPLSSVVAVFERVKAQTENTFRMRKQVFFEMFVDYSFQGTSGGFLKLPLEEFERVVVDNDANGNKIANTRETFVLLALLCDGNFDDRMRLMFQVFDRTDSKSITNEEMVEMVTLLLKGLKLAEAIGIDQHEISADKLVAEVRQKTAEDTKSHDSISEDEFVVWSNAELNERGVISQLVRADEKKEEQEAETKSGAKGRRKPRRQIKLNAKISKAAHDRAQKQFGSKALEKKKVENAVRDARRISSVAGGSAERGALTAGGAGVHASRMKRYETKQAFRQRQGKLSAVATNKLMVELQLTTNLGYGSLNALREEFGEASNKKDHGQMVLTMTRFKELMIAKFKNLEDGKILQRVAEAYEADESGTIDFGEFVRGLSKFSGSIDEQIEFLCHMMHHTCVPQADLENPDMEKSMEYWEIADVLQDAYDDYEEVGKYMLEHIGSLHSHHATAEKSYKRQELIEIASEPMYLHFMWVYLPPVFPAMITAFDKIWDEVEGGITLQQLLNLARDEDFCGVTGADAPSGSAVKTHGVIFDTFWIEFCRCTSLGEELGMENVALRANEDGDKEDDLREPSATDGTPIAVEEKQPGTPASPIRQRVEHLKRLVRDFFALFALHQRDDGHQHLSYYVPDWPKCLREKEADSAMMWAVLAKLCCRKQLAPGTLIDAKDRSVIVYMLMTWGAPCQTGGTDAKDHGPAEISHETVHVFLRETMRRMEGAGDHIVDMLKVMDLDGDGFISIDELKKNAIANPDVFLTLLGI